MTITRRLVLLGTAMMGLYTAAGAQAQPDSDPFARCTALESTDFTTIVDGPTQITRADWVLLSAA